MPWNLVVRNSKFFSSQEANTHFWHPKLNKPEYVSSSLPFCRFCYEAVTRDGEMIDEANGSADASSRLIDS